jgi:hypothetical protein
MATTPTTPLVIQQKLAAFELLEAEFEACFQFVQEVHGQKRFSSFPVADSVRYLHALWVCECKDRLLSIFKNIQRYEGRYCLELLRMWQQEQDTASVVAFLDRKLDMLPFTDLTRQLHEARYTHQDDGLVQRLAHGRLVLLNRGMNLMHALDAIFSLSEQDLFKEVQAACERYGHLPGQIEAQLQEMEAPLYSFIPNQALAQRNMVIMNKLGVNVALKPADLPGQRSWRIVPPEEPLQPFAEHVVKGYLELTAPWHNNIRGLRFVDRPEPSDTVI